MDAAVDVNKVGEREIPRSACRCALGISIAVAFTHGLDKNEHVVVGLRSSSQQEDWDWRGRWRARCEETWRTQDQLPMCHKSPVCSNNVGCVYFPR